MASTTYVVAIDLQTKGDLGVGRLTPHVSRLSSALGGTVSRFSGGMSAGVSRLTDGFKSLASTAASVAGTIATWAGVGAGAGIVGLAGWTVHLNDELEKTKISLGAIFNAQGFSSNLQQGLSMAGEQIGKMRKDAAALPGEFQDLVGIFQAISIPGAQAGLGPDAIRQLASKVMAAGAVANLPMDQVAREAAMLMSGRSGAHNVLGMRLMGLSGDSAERFNKMDADKRVALMTKELDKYAPAIDEFSRSFEGVSSTFKDNAKTFALLAGNPLFERIKATFSSANAWFDQNKALVSSWGEAVGDKLGYAFEVGIAKIQEWWPAIRDFATNAYSRLVDIWTTIQPYVEQFGSALQTALKDPGTIDKLIHLAEVYAGIKLGGALIGGAVGAVQLGGSIAGNAAKIGGMAASAWDAVSNTASSAFLGLTSGATIAGTTFTGLAGMALSLTVGLGAVVGAGAALYEGIQLWDDASKNAAADGLAQADMAHKLLTSSESVSEAYANTQTALYEYIDANNTAAAEAINAALAFSALGAAVSSYDIASKRGERDIQPTLDRVNDMFLGAARESLDPSNKKNIPLKHPGGGGGTNIQKVEIVVTSNQEPSRIAREVKDVLADLHRRPKVSPDVANYSRPAG